MATPDIESVEYDVRIEAALALKNLAELTTATSSFNQKIRETTMAVKSASEQWGVSFQTAKNQLQSLDAELSGTAESSVIFGGAGQAAWQQVGEGATQAAQATEQGTQRMVGGINLVRTAIHFLVVGALFELIQAVKSTFTELINNIRESELAIYNLVNAEERLSKQGIDVTPKGLQETIDGVKKLVPILSIIQSQELVSRVATNVAPSLGLTDTQIKQLSESVALLYVRNKALGKSFDEVEASVTNAFLTGRVSQGINQLGVKISDQIVKDEALRLGLVKSEEEFNNLTGEVEAHIKAVAMLSVVYKNASQDIGSVNDYMQTTDSQIETTKTLWSDFITLLGKLDSPIIKVGLKGINNALEILIVLLEKLKPIFIELMSLEVGFIETTRNVFQYKNIKEFFQAWIENSKKVAESMQGLGAAADTATVPINNLSDAASNFTNTAKAMQEAGDKLADILQENKDKLADIERQYQEKQQDIARNYSQKLQDIDIAVARKRADALTDYNNKVVDINNDASKKTVEAKQEAKKKEIEIEQKYQQELKNLQQKYLMDLEEALHNRDARQILRLMRQYAFDKQALEEKRKQDRQEAKVELAQKLQDIENERKEKLAAAQREYQEKLKEIQLYLQRERQDAQTALRREMEDARIAHERTLAEQRLYLQRKLRDLADALMKEYNLTKTMVEAIFKLWAAKYGTSLPSFSTTTSPTSGGTSSGSSFASFSATQAAVTGGMGYGLAEGGSFLATTPTKLNVAENGPELISATPLGKVGSDLNKLFMQMGGAKDSGSATNAIELGVTLSPDLETRIIKKSLDETASVVMRVNRGNV